jgi:hypothetical protein
MFFLQYKAMPLPDHATAAKGWGGAVANCWVDRSTAVEAEIVAKQMIESEGWQVIETVEVRELPEAHCGLSESAQRYYEQALLDREVVVFYTFPENGE